MQLTAGIKPHIAQQVEHDGRGMLARLRQGQARHGMDLQVKLRHVTGVNGVVAAVVWARGHLVDNQTAVLTAVFHHKKLDAQHPDIVDMMRY